MDHFNAESEKNLFFQVPGVSTNSFCGQAVCSPVDDRQKLATDGALSALPIF